MKSIGTKNEIFILVPSPADLDAVVMLGERTQELKDKEQGRFFTNEALASLLNSPVDIFLLAKNLENVVGFVIAHINQNLKELYISDIVVTHSFRDQGVGDKLIREVLSKAKDRGVTSVWCIVQETNDKMMHFLTKRGFTQGHKFYFYGKTL